MAILPRKQVHILCGASGAGKTTLVLQAIAEAERGNDFPLTFSVEPYVNYVVADRTADETLARIHALGIRNIEVYGVSDDKQLNLRLLDDPARLFQTVTDSFKRQGNILVLDPIMLFMEDEGKSYASVARSLIRMSRFCVEHDLVTLCTHHAVKTRSDYQFLRPQDRISGSAAFQGFSGTQMVLIQGSESGADYDRFFVVPHLSPPEEYRLVRDDRGWFKVQTNEALDQLRALVAAVKGLLIPKKEIDNMGAIVGLHPDQLRQVLGELGVADGPSGFYRKL